jgi:hypothetical protein
MWGNKIYVAEAVLDFSERNMASTETVKLLTIPANTLILDVIYEVKTAEGAALTIDIGDSSNPTLVGDNINCNSTSTHDNAAFGSPQYYSAADYIEVLCNTAGANTAVVVVKMVCVDMSDARSSY